MKYACITRHRDEYDIRLMCRVLLVSPSGYYGARDRTPSARARRDEELLVHVRAIHQKSRRAYGAPRICHALGERDLRCGQKRVARIMRTDGLRAVGRRKFRVTTDSKHAHPIAPNTLARQFAPAEIAAPNRVWASDITYLWTRNGWLYLAVVLDLASRRVIGWALGATLDRALPLTALHMALALRQGVAGALHHSDRGSQYASADYRAVLAAHAIACSMSRRGNCWDNAVVESFFATLKKELVYETDWTTREEAQVALVEYIEEWYNPERKHTSLGFRSPIEYENEMLMRAKAV